MRCRFALTTALLLALSTVSFAPQPRPAITGLCFVRFKVSSLGEADKFYAKDLALSRSTKCWAVQADTCFYITPYQDVEIVQADTPGSAGSLDMIGIWTEDAAALRSYLLARGVDVGELVSVSNAFQYFELSDPEQHRLRFLWVPGAPQIIPEPAEQVSHHMIHAGFVVSDRAAMDRFYKDILGFHVYWHGGMKDDETNWVDMQVPEATDWLEYMLNVPPNASHKTLGVMNHIALGVRDIHAAQQQLIKNGWKGNEEPKIGRDGKWQLNLYDPDETRVELMEFTPVEKPCCSEYTGPHPKP
jgi:catechol 2,3-dioxygenase-like lactoylglutathione lyase family enzyme